MPRVMTQTPFCFAMTSSSGSAGAVIGFFLLLQLVGFLALLLGGLYLLYCLQRTANNLDRLANVAEEWLRRQPAMPIVPVAPTPASPVPPAYLPAASSETSSGPSVNANPTS